MPFAAITEVEMHVIWPQFRGSLGLTTLKQQVAASLASPSADAARACTLQQKEPGDSRIGVCKPLYYTSAKSLRFLHQEPESLPSGSCLLLLCLHPLQKGSSLQHHVNEMRNPASSHAHTILHYRTVSSGTPADPSNITCMLHPAVQTPTFGMSHSSNTPCTNESPISKSALRKELRLGVSI